MKDYMYLKLLNEENEELKRENEYLKRLFDRDLEYSILSSPKTIPLQIDHNEIVLTRVAGVEAVKEFDGWHIRGSLNEPDRIVVSYFMSNINMINKHGVAMEFEYCLQSVMKAIYKKVVG